MNEKITVDMKKLTSTEREQLIKLLGKASGELNKKIRAWKPEHKESYYYIDSLNRVCKDSWDNAVVDESRLNTGNAFMTKEEANVALEKKKVKAELERYALEHNDPEKEAWNGKNRHYALLFDHETKDFICSKLSNHQEELATYFTSEKIAREAITTIGRERIAKYLFNVEV